MYTRFRDHGEEPPLHLFGQIKRIARDWIDEGYLVCKGGTVPAMVTYREMAEKAAERIYLACQRQEHGEKRIKAILDAYNPTGSTRHVNFATSKPTLPDLAATCHINYVVCDSEWEAELARVLESHPRGARLRQEPGHAVRGAVSRRRRAAEIHPRFHRPASMTAATSRSISCWRPRAIAAAMRR